MLPLLSLPPSYCNLTISAVKSGDGFVLALVPTCPWIERKDVEKLKATAAAVFRKAVEYAKEHPEIAVEYRADYVVVIPAGEGSGE